MTDTTLSPEAPPPDITLTRLLDSHGTLPTLRTLASVLWARRRRPAQAHDLPNHLRRDIGLPPRPTPRPTPRPPDRLGPWV